MRGRSEDWKILEQVGGRPKQGTGGRKAQAGNRWEEGPSREQVGAPASCRLVETNFFAILWTCRRDAGAAGLKARHIAPVLALREQCIFHW